MHKTKRIKARELKPGDWILISSQSGIPLANIKWIRVDRIIPRPSSGGIRIAIYAKGQHIRTLLGSQAVVKRIPDPAAPLQFAQA